MHYVARWRMHVALTWLKEEDAPVSEMASRLGYESEARSAGRSSDFSGSLRGPFDGRGQIDQINLPKHLTCTLNSREGFATRVEERRRRKPPKSRQMIGVKPITTT